MGRLLQWNLILRPAWPHVSAAATLANNSPAIGWICISRAADGVTSGGGTTDLGSMHHS